MTLAVFAPALRTPVQVAEATRRQIAENIHRGYPSAGGAAADIRAALLVAARGQEEVAPERLRDLLLRDLPADARAWAEGTLAACPEVATLLRRMAGECAA